MEPIGKQNDLSREYKYDNIKFILIFLVVLGHIIEKVKTLDGLYLMIYSFHMPVFVFISGYFSKGNKKSILKPISIYFVFQTLYYLLYRFLLNKNIVLNYGMPIWILWYMFSLSVWNSVLLVLRKFKITKNMFYYILLGSFLLSLICGYIDVIGYAFSLSRIITFFPFFMLGYCHKNYSISKSNINAFSHKYVVCLIVAIVCGLYFFSIPNINKVCFYGSYSYRIGGYDIVFRIMSYLFGVVMIYFFNSCISNKKTIFSEIGKNTLIIYLLHGIIIKIFNQSINSILTNDNVWFNLAVAILLAIIIIARNRNTHFCNKQNM